MLKGYAAAGPPTIGTLSMGEPAMATARVAGDGDSTLLAGAVCGGEGSG
jgi:hypothetical protein